MKKIMKLFALLFVVGTLFIAVSCDKEVTVDSISIDTTSIPTEILTTELDDKLDDIKIQVKKSDDSSETINLSKSMISADDLAKLSTEGTYTITITYEGKTAELTIKIVKPTEEKPDDDNPVDKKVEYSVLIKDIAGKPLADFYVEFYLGDDIVAEGYTGGNGIFAKELEPNKYEVVIEERDGYVLNNSLFETDLLGSQIVVDCELDDLSGIKAPSTHLYQLGDLMYDFTLVDTEGTELTLYELLAEYDAVLLNFWYTTCSACYYEFPYMNDAYESTYTDESGATKNYSDDIAIIAVNPGIAGNGDTLEDIKQFKESMGLSFNVCMDYDADASNLTMDPALTRMFSITGYPTTVIVDRYGLIADIEVGAITDKAKWTQTFDKYIGSDYEPIYTGGTAEDEYVKPDIKQEDSSVLEAAINGTNYDGSKFNGKYEPEDDPDDAEFSWPWIVEEFEGKTAIRPSNRDQNPSFSIVYTNVTLKEGEALAFDYYASTESYDILYVIVDGSIATQISGQSPDWEKSYCYIALEDGTYEVALCYYKDGSYSMGEDAVYVTNMRIVETADIDKETYIYREAAYGTINEITMRYTKYITPVYNEEDGYYHVNSVNGPLLMADMLSGTQWNNSDLYNISLEAKCIGADGVDYNKLVEKYAVYASNSELGYCPVTKELADALKQIVKALGAAQAASNENQWLEVCVYYSAYGTNGVEVGDPTIGVTPNTPIMFEGNGIDEAATAEANFNRIILPRGFIFGFIPEKSGVYQFYSTEEELETVAWTCDEDGAAVGGTDEELRIFAANVYNNIPNDLNFVAHVYLEEGKLYLFRAAFYDIYEYSTITVEMKYHAEKTELLTVASPGPFTSSDDEMSDIISGNYVDYELGEDGYYVVKDSLATDKYLYADFTYQNAITGYSLLDCLNRFNAFDFSKDEFGNALFDENGYYRFTGYAEDNVTLVSYFVCYDSTGETFYVEEVGADGFTEANGYTYITTENISTDLLDLTDCTEYVKQYIEANMITDTESELYGCVKVDEKFASVLWALMDKYTFAGIEGSWLKLCYYYKYVGPTPAAE